MSYLRDYLDFPPDDFRHRDAARIIDKFETDAHVHEGVVYWVCNGRVPPDEILELWTHAGKAFDLERSKERQSQQTHDFLKEYIRTHTGPSPEEVAEARAAFGPGHELVNIVTGTKFVT